MKGKINSYIAMLFITVFASGAALIIVHIGTTDVIAAALAGNEANYRALQQSILLNKY